MFECHACFRRYVRAVLSSTTPERSTTQVRTPQYARRAFQSTYAAPRDHEPNTPVDFSNATRTGERSRLEQNGQRGSPVIRKTTAPERAPPSEHWNAQKTRAKAALVKQRTPYAKPIGKSTRLTPGNISTELKYLKDPLKLADHVRYVLSQDDGEKALALVRMSSKQLANTVSWNHMIDWQMKNRRANAALDTYNEVFPACYIPLSEPIHSPTPHR